MRVPGVQLLVCAQNTRQSLTVIQCQLSEGDSINLRGYVQSPPRTYLTSQDLQSSIPSKSIIFLPAAVRDDPFPGAAYQTRHGANCLRQGEGMRRRLVEITVVDLAHSGRKAGAA